MPNELVKRKHQRTAKARSHAHLPCKTCPWRIGSDVSAIPGYNQEKAVGLLRTASAGNGDGLRPIMACHNSTDENMHACKGYLAREGWSNINVRILLAEDRISNPSRVLEACEMEGVQLEPDYPAVLKKLRGEGNADA